MSSILKALKKLEDQNNARTPDSLRINSDILRGGDSPRFSTLGIVLAALLLFLGGGVASYLFMKPEVKIPASTMPRPLQTTPAATRLQAPTVLAEKPKRNPATISTLTVKTVRNKQLQQLNAAKQPLDPVPTHQLEHPESSVVSARARPVVRVNGIAFQDGSDSVAVINDVPVSKGAVIEGVKVEEIQRDRVQFSYGGEKFEVLLGKSNQ